MNNSTEKRSVREFRMVGDFMMIAAKEGESIFCIPYAYHADSSTPYIEIVKNGEVTRTFNCNSVAEIRYA